MYRAVKFVTQLMTVFLLLMLYADGVSAAELRIAVASNFTEAAKVVAKAFKADTGKTVKLSFGSTGKLYAQIVHGAPFDVFLAADRERPEQLAKDGRVLPGARTTYAHGRLVLWSPDPSLVSGDLSALKMGDFRRLAIANPKTAPYGGAAMDVLEKLGILTTVEPKLVRGNNIAQTYQFVVSGNAELGFIAASQANHQSDGSRWQVPTQMHRSLAQEAVALSSTKNPDLARQFLNFLVTPKVQAMISDLGYSVEAEKYRNNVQTNSQAVGRD